MWRGPLCLALAGLFFVGCSGERRPKELGFYILSRGQLLKVQKQQQLDKPEEGVTYAVGFRHPPTVVVPDSLPRFAYYDADAQSKIERTRLIRLGYVGTKAQSGFLFTPAHTVRINLYQEVETVPMAVTPDKRDARLFWLRPEQSLGAGCYALIVPFQRAPKQRLQEEDSGFAFRVTGPTMPSIATWPQGKTLYTFSAPMSDVAYAALKGAILEASPERPQFFADLYHLNLSHGRNQILVITRNVDLGLRLSGRLPPLVEQLCEFQRPRIMVRGDLSRQDNEYVKLRFQSQTSDSLVAALCTLMDDLGSDAWAFILTNDLRDLDIISATPRGALLGGLTLLPPGKSHVLEWGAANVSR